MSLRSKRLISPYKLEGHPYLETIITDQQLPELYVHFVSLLVPQRQAKSASPGHASKPEGIHEESIVSTAGVSAELSESLIELEVEMPAIDPMMDSTISPLIIPSTTFINFEFRDFL